MAKLRSLGHLVSPIDMRIARPAPKEADPHYHSPEHRAWRAEVIRRAGGTCQGKLPDGRICGATGVRLYADHIHELRDGGAPLDPANGQALCDGCHNRKTAAERARRLRG